MKEKIIQIAVQSPTVGSGKFLPPTILILTNKGNIFRMDFGLDRGTNSLIETSWQKLTLPDFKEE